MPLWNTYLQLEPELEDAWNRRRNAPCYERRFMVNGMPVLLTGNDASALAVAEAVEPLYSRAQEIAAPPFVIHLVTADLPHAGAPPHDLIDHVQYSAHGPWMALQLGRWGHCHSDHAVGLCRAVLDRSLAGRPNLVVQCMMNTVLTNMLQQRGVSMLHATGLARDNHVLLLIAPHNSGKSTTALRLVMHGWRLLADSQVYSRREGERLDLTGFPVGRIKLRNDMTREFPQLASLLTPERVRSETKHAVDLRRVDPALVCQEAIAPERIDLCLLTRSHSRRTDVAPAQRDEVERALVRNSLHVNPANVWAANLATLEALLDRARLHHLAVGTDAGEIAAAVDRLTEQP
jgi:hypothetical protein